MDPRFLRRKPDEVAGTSPTLSSLREVGAVMDRLSGQRYTATVQAGARPGIFGVADSAMEWDLDVLLIAVRDELQRIQDGQYVGNENIEGILSALGTAIRYAKRTLRWGRGPGQDMAAEERRRKGNERELYAVGLRDAFKEREKEDARQEIYFSHIGEPEAFQESDTWRRCEGCKGLFTSDALRKTQDDVYLCKSCGEGLEAGEQAFREGFGGFRVTLPAAPSPSPKPKPRARKPLATRGPDGKFHMRGTGASGRRRGASRHR